MPWDRTTGVIGPQGSGNTLHLLAPALLQAPGAALVTLTKVDDLLLSFAVRSRDDRPCMVLDDVALALAWNRRLPDVISVAVDPGWVKTKLASPGAPGDVSSSADTIAFCCTAPDLASAPYWKNRAPALVPRPLRDPALQDAIFAACDRMVGVG